LTGWKQEDAVGGLLGNVFHIMNEKTRERCANPFEKIMKTGQIVGLANNTVLVARDRTERIIADSGAPIRDRDGELIGVILVFRDITEQRKLEEELGRSQKLESVGLLAAGIAHDFNNILTAIMGNISLATLNTYPETKISDYLNNAEKAILRAKHLTEQLLTFSKGGMPVTSLAELGELLREAATFALRGSNVKCEYSIADDLWPAEIDSGQISQVFPNLVLNGKQAMPEGGVITIKAENFSYNNLREKQGDLPLAAGDYLVVNISDQGSGIPEKALQKIFDPYFTTKEEGQGLGLATSHAIVKKHNGHVSVYSKVGFGTTFTIYLPASPDQVMGDEQEKSADLPVGSGRILVMDDEDIVLEVAAQMVTELGYEPSIAKDGKETIILFQQAMEEQRPFDLVILDLTIPGGMGGKETIQRLLELDPRIKAMVSSGYSNDPVLAEYKTYGFCGIIEKPYNINELAKAIQNARG
ncbi:MAG: response regulator, partial [Desulfobulbaceae bacterium]|nr:response regulator [Desulfobulbaceae bacterium]